MQVAGSGGLAVQSTNVFFIERRRLVELAAENRLPVIDPTREFVDAGGLMSCVANTADLFERRDLRGQDPQGREAWIHRLSSPANLSWQSTSKPPKLSA